MSTDPRARLRWSSGEEHEPRLAARCRWVRVTFDPARGHDIVNLCTHIVREGTDCIGPFLDDAETTCGLFEHRD